MKYTIALCNVNGSCSDYRTANSLTEVRNIVRRHFNDPMIHSERWSTDDADLAVMWEGEVKPWFTMDMPVCGFVPGPRGGIRRRDW